LAVGEHRSWLGRQLADLPELDRNLLLARFGDGSVTAVGQQFGIGADAAHGRLRRALIRMRQRAAEWWHG
jgi:DNA-directed RNA polymerase specialized sigma24 family protein